MPAAAAPGTTVEAERKMTLAVMKTHHIIIIIIISIKSLFTGTSVPW